MQKRMGIAAVGAGVLTGIMLYWAWMLLGDADFVLYIRDREKEIACYQEAENLKPVFYKNREEFKGLEAYYREIKDWEFEFREFSSTKEGRTGKHAYAVYDSSSSPRPYVLVYALDGQEYDEAELPGSMKQFLTFLADERFVLSGSVIVHGETDPYQRQKHMKRFMEVRCYEGRDVVSFIFDPTGSAKEEQWESITELEDGWYLCSFKILPEGLEGI